MNKIICILLLLTSFSIRSYAQQGKIINVESGKNLENFTSQEYRYLFENFENGTVLFNNGSVGQGKMNYNLLVGEMQFIDSKTEEILALANVQDVTAVSIAGRMFIPFSTKSNEFMEILLDGDLSLTIKRKTTAVPYGKAGAYGTVNTSAAITSVSSIDYDVKRESLSVSEYQQISIQTDYYLVSTGKHILITTKKTILDAIPKNKRPQIEQYMADRNLNLKEEQDLIKLIEYCNQL
jgi:hypothetical protein